MGPAYEFLWYFFLYAFLGWCCEVCFAAAKEGRFVNRGFLNGPVCPIYGFGVVVVVGLLAPVRENVFLLFFCSVILTSALEWITGFVLEKAFHQKWWDYSEMPFNLNGYICLLFSLLWGLACLLIMDVIHPMVASLVGHIPHTLGLVLLGVFTAVILADLGATVATIAKLNRRLGQLDELAARIHALSDGLGEDLAERRAALEEKKAALEARHSELLSHRPFGQGRLLKAFPHMKSTRHGAALEQLKERLRRAKKER